MATLKISDVRKSYGANVILNGINIDLEHGDFLVLLGPSGCGKSTLLNMIAGLETIDSGDVSIGDRVVNKVHPKDRDIAMVFQSYALYPNMTVGKNITFGMARRKVPKAEQQVALKHVAGLLQIENLLDRRPAQLSGGQRQRVAMGRALVRDPHVFLFDEPLSNLDAKLRGEMRTEIKRLHQRLGATIVYVTHDQVEAMTLATQVAVMKAGAIQQYGTPQHIYAKPSNMFVAGFIGAPAMNFIPAKVVSTDGGGYALALRHPTAPGGEVKLSLDEYESQDLNRYQGRDVILGMRPEDISRHVPNGAPTLADTVACKIDVVEPTGADTLIVTTMAGREVTARLPPKHAGAAGETVLLKFNMAEASLFDPETEERI